MSNQSKNPWQLSNIDLNSMTTDPRRRGMMIAGASVTVAILFCMFALLLFSVVNWSYPTVDETALASPTAQSVANNQGLDMPSVPSPPTATNEPTASP
ncbi:hypothetical protein QUF64_07780, partial [Anaerolineales bacterium HSG6]|nr:hypothetical protein [Anaerolineales bacterium HSG6]